jgi:hypothetical protein
MKSASVPLIKQERNESALPWIASAVILDLMLILSLFYLPKGLPPR